ncbi:hypothetical protein [Bradyrhizobium sp. USDA 4473]
MVYRISCPPHVRKCSAAAISQKQQLLVALFACLDSKTMPKWPNCLVKDFLMTIAACYLSPEGVVLGADSTTTYNGINGIPHYFNQAQKLFEVGDGGSLGMVTWGLGGLAVSSYRQLIAVFADDLVANPPTSVQDAASRWCHSFWQQYVACPYAKDIARCATLAQKAPFDPSGQSPTARTQAEEDELNQLRENFTVGFCLGGYADNSRAPAAYQMIFDPAQGQPQPDPIPLSAYRFWGAPNFIKRLLFGCDDGLKSAILDSGKWAGTPQDLDALVGQFELGHPVVPIRDAIDFAHACIQSTIKAIKFSNFPQICGGPIEIAVITVDRKFRWVKHKPWDTAINEGNAS